MREGLTPHGERHLCVKVAEGEGADVADVIPLIRHLCAHDDQRRVQGGVAAFEVHTLRPRPER